MPQEGDYPQELEHTIPNVYGHATCCAFNRRGTLLAIGCQEGIINMLVFLFVFCSFYCPFLFMFVMYINFRWDFETRSIVSVLSGHRDAVSSISWSRNGRRLLVSDYSGYLILWDVKIGKPLIKLKFNCILEYSWLHQRISYVFISFYLLLYFYFYLFFDSKYPCTVSYLKKWFENVFLCLVFIFLLLLTLKIANIASMQ